MAKKTRAALKSLFKNGMKPDENDFADMIDSGINFSDDDITIANGNVGIDTTDPKATLHVYDNGSDDFVQLENKTATLMVGNPDGRNLSIDNNEIMAKNGVDTSTLHLQTNGGDIELYWFNDQENQIIIKDTGRIGIGTDNPVGPFHVDTSSNEFVVDTDGNVGIGTASPDAPLHIYSTSDQTEYDEPGGALIIGDSTGLHLSIDNNEIMAKNSDVTSGRLYLNRQGGRVDIGMTGNHTDFAHYGSVISTSDKKLKTEIKNLDKGVAEVLKLKPVSYKWKADVEKNDLKYGFIAQDVEKVLEDVTYTDKESGVKGLSVMELVPVLTKAIQEQQKQIETLESRLEKLEKLVQKK